MQEQRIEALQTEAFTRRLERLLPEGLIRGGEALLRLGRQFADQLERMAERQLASED